MKPEDERVATALHWEENLRAITAELRVLGYDARLIDCDRAGFFIEIPDPSDLMAYWWAGDVTEWWGATKYHLLKGDDPTDNVDTHLAVEERNPVLVALALHLALEAGEGK